VYPEIPQGTFPTVNEIDGAVNIDKARTAGIEALLDFEISYPVIYPQNSVLYLTDDRYEARRFKGGLFNTFLDAIDGSYCTYEGGDDPKVDPHYPNPGYEHPEQCGVFKPTNVISFSYELAEFKEGTTEAYQQRQCNEYMKLGLQGVTVVFSSGDSGVASAWGCKKGPQKQPIFNPNFPSNCPYVLSVGATTLTGNAATDDERAVTQFPSGGGFANYFARPSYQDKAVNAFLSGPDKPTFPAYSGSSYGNGLYNSSGRAYPDVAAIGQSVVNYGQGQPYLVGGTSASAPLWAALLTRINEERLGAGKTTVGFVNPTIYQNPQAFHDITVGNNFACQGKGFKVAKGWDPVTGLGTPNYPALLDVFMKA
jgi:tripeptidyl-peptidase I